MENLFWTSDLITPNPPPPPQIPKLDLLLKNFDIAETLPEGYRLILVSTSTQFIS